MYGSIRLKQISVSTTSIRVRIVLLADYISEGDDEVLSYTYV